jgi:hypothetical protein
LDIEQQGLAADFLILADAAQVQGEKLYLLGGGWSTIWAKEFPTQHQMSLAAGILVPWLETNRKHEFRIVIRSDKGQVFGEIKGHFEQGRPPGLPAGAPQRLMLAANLAIKLESPTEAIAELQLDGQVAKSVPFRVVERPAQRT